MTWLWATLALATTSGCVSAWEGNRTAWALLASLALCLGLSAAGAQFVPLVWVAIDLAVIGFIASSGLSAADCIIIALFIPAWAGYALPQDERFVVGTLAVSAQLLMTFPIVIVWKRVREFNRQFNPWDHFDLRARHEDAT